MTDTSYDHDQLALGPDHTAAMRETWIANGYDAVVFDRAANPPDSLPGNHAPPAPDAAPVAMDTRRSWERLP